ncbi:MAG: recombination mediator RecR [Armatimonadota bacterium]
MYYAKPLARLIGELEKLPGIGPKSAQRLAFHLLSIPREEAQMLADAIVQVKDSIRLCRECFNFTDRELCEICSDPRRERSVICIVAEVRDLIAIEKTGHFRGLYHVLHGVIAPMEGVGPEQLKIRELLERLKSGTVKEVILAFNPTVEGDATAMYLAGLLRPIVPEVTQVAHGLPIGGDMDYADQATLIQAIAGRRKVI